LINIGDTVRVGQTPYDDERTPPDMIMEGKTGQVRDIEWPGGTALYMVELEGRRNPGSTDNPESGWAFWESELTVVKGDSNG